MLGTRLKRGLSAACLDANRCGLQALLVVVLLATGACATEHDDESFGEVSLAVKNASNCLAPAIQEIRQQINALKATRKALRQQFTTALDPQKEALRQQILAVQSQIKMLRGKIKKLSKGESCEPEDECTGNYCIGNVPATAYPADVLSLTWEAPEMHSSQDWIALYKENSLIEDYSDWIYVPVGVYGEFTLTIPTDATLGGWEVRYLSFETGSSEEVVRSRTIQVVGR